MAVRWSKYRDSRWQGHRAGKLTVLGVDESYSGRQVRWRVQCDCGREKSVFVFSIFNGDSKSCGIEPCAGRGTHYRTNTRLFRIWRGMRGRCLNPTDHAYPNYGGRGISICRDWSKFETFHRWAVTHGYRDDLTLDRRNNDRGYAPSNCRWISRGEQAANRRNCLLIKGKPVKYWAAQLRITPEALHYRAKKGWTEDRMILPRTK